MNGNKSWIEKAFWTLSVLSMVAYIIVSKIDPLVFTKAWSILFLVALAVRYAGDRPAPRHRRIIIGLAFGAAGDVFLAAPERVFFVSGAICFLCGHCFYLAAFYAKRSVNIFLFIALALVGAAVSFIIIDYSIVNGDWITGVTALAYTAVILAMAYFGITTGDSRIRWGAILFVLSDGLLSYNFFIEQLVVLSLLLWLAYYGAQALIALSIKYGKYDQG